MDMEEGSVQEMEDISMEDISMDPNVSEVSIEELRKGQDQDSILDTYSISALDWSCLSNKEPASDGESPKPYTDAQPLAVPRRHNVPKGSVADSEKLQLESSQAAVELEHPSVSPWPMDPTPVPATMMCTPISETSNKQVIPNAPLPPLRGKAPRNYQTSFRDATQGKLFNNASPITNETGYTKPPIPQNFSSDAKAPVLASIMSSALERASLNRVSPLFEMTGTSILPAVHQEPTGYNSMSSTDIAKDVATPGNTLSTHSRNKSTCRKILSELRDNEIPNEDDKVMLKQSAAEEVSSYRKRKFGTVISKSEGLDPEQDRQLTATKPEEINKFSPACSVPNQQIDPITIMGRRFPDEVFQKTSTPIYSQAFSDYQMSAAEDCICPISCDSSTLDRLPPWRRFEQGIPRPALSRMTTPFSHGSFNSETNPDTRSAIAGRKQSKKSCTLRPDWILPLEVDRGNKGEEKASRKVSVVDKSKRKLTPYTQGVDSLLIPTDSAQSPLEKLAPFTRKCAITPPLYIVHPITGSVKILQEMAKGLHIRCYGIKKTHQTPDTSVELMAKFYCEAVLKHQKTGSYNLAGYSYGGLVVFEMARLLQQAGKQVAVLIMIDGSPAYVKSQLSAIRQSSVTDSDPQHAKAVVESHLLLFFIGIYKPVQEPELVRTMLEEQPSHEDRVAAAVGVTLGTVQVSSLARGRWLGLKSKTEQSQQKGKVKVSISHVAQDVISLRRQQKAIAILQAASIAEKHELEGNDKFQGDIHLMRIQSMPKGCRSLSPDYNLRELCEGTVHVNFVDGEHESMMETPHVESLIQAVNLALEKVMDYRK